ncbi:MAG: hypothetical protein JWQ24_4673 [Tardiphaga sp.]|nr:hypothetical protein [Tardiphaga sp.]
MSDALTGLTRGPEGVGADYFSFAARPGWGGRA